ncbi:MAG: response regulator [Pseudomonadota bacterium]
MQDRGARLGKILLVEDEPNIIEALRFLLSREGWSVLVHSNGADAVARVEREDPDLVILDVMLPNRSGYDILSELRQRPDARDLPILMLTARGQAKDRERALGAGADAFMTKPFSNDEILATVSQLSATQARSA